jgi:CBS domain containing-hemolysin-like protein
MLELIIVILIVLVASGLCSGSEAALFSIPLIKARQLAQDGTRASHALLRIRENMSRPIASIVILNNIANIVGSIIVGALATRLLGAAWLGVVSGALTFLVIIFAEIIPKTLGERYADRIALMVARPVLVLTFLFTPLVWMVEKLTAPLTAGKPLPVTNEAEIQLMADLGRQEGVIEADESEMIKRVFRLNDVTAGDIMTPRVAMTTLPASASLDAVRERIAASPHSRIVVTASDEDMDDVRGVALQRDLLAALVSGHQATSVFDYTREVEFIPESVRADQLLEFFRNRRQHLAVVIDEYGGVSGVVSLEDVVETLTGEIVDETDRVVDLRAVARKRGQAALSRQDDGVTGWQDDRVAEDGGGGAGRAGG